MRMLTTNSESGTLSDATDSAGDAAKGTLAATFEDDDPNHPAYKVSISQGV